MSSVWTAEGGVAIACARGLAPYALAEARALGFGILAHDLDSVTVRGTMLDALRLNLHLRAAHRVLFPVGRFEAKNLGHLYAHAMDVPWEDWLPPDGYFSVRGSVRNDTVRDTRMPALRLKDAVADRMREACGRRPDSGKEDAGAALFFVWRERDLRVFIDTSGAPLSRRGYRLLPGKAPMQETLAAACVMASGWDGDSPFVAPMCGSGTPAIEAAMIARRRAPGLARGYFAFRHLRGYGDALEDGPRFASLPGGLASLPPSPSPDMVWKALAGAAAAAERPAGEMPRIVATDISREAVRIARANAKAAGMDRHISFGVCDFADTAIPRGEPGVVFVNPEYGERMGDAAELAPLYRRIGAWYGDNRRQTRCALTSSPRLARALCGALGEEPGATLPFFNGALDCRLLVFRGTRREPPRGRT